MDSLVADLRRLGVRPGDTLMLHASLRRIGARRDGPVDAAAVLDAVEDAASPGGTLLMTMGALDDHDWVNGRPEEEREALLADATPFDPLATPVQPDVGVLAEVFRTRPGTLVSNHPEGRFGASGARAPELLHDVPWDDYYGPGSPLERFVAAGGRVLRIGADADTTTLLHHAEYLCDVPGKRRVRRHRKVMGPDGPVVRVVECLDDSEGIVHHHGRDEFAAILRDYLGTGRASLGTVGEAEAALLDGADVLAFGTAWLTEHLGAVARGAEPWW